MLKELKNLCVHYHIDGRLLTYRPEKSKKQLLAKWVIENALNNGELKKGQAVAEITAGNFGVALAEQCRKINSHLYLVPLGVFPPHIIEKLNSFDNVTIINAKQNRNILSLKQTLEKVIKNTHAYSFRQFGNNRQINFYKDLLKNVLSDVKIDAVFEKVGTGATLQSIKEILDDSQNRTEYYIAKSLPLQIETAHLILSLDGIKQVHPADRLEYNKFEDILIETENLYHLDYAKLSLYCAIEWLKQNPKKTAFVFIGD